MLNAVADGRSPAQAMKEAAGAGGSGYDGISISYDRHGISMLKPLEHFITWARAATLAMSSTDIFNRVFADDRVWVFGVTEDATQRARMDEDRNAITNIASRIPGWEGGPDARPPRRRGNGQVQRRRR